MQSDSRYELSSHVLLTLSRFSSRSVMTFVLLPAVAMGNSGVKCSQIPLLIPVLAPSNTCRPNTPASQQVSLFSPSLYLLTLKENYASVATFSLFCYPSFVFNESDEKVIHGAVET